MDSQNDTWPKVFVLEQDGLQEVTSSKVVEGIRVFKRETYQLPTDPDGEKRQMHDKTVYGTADMQLQHATLEAALEHAKQPAAQ